MTAPVDTARLRALLGAADLGRVRSNGSVVTEAGVHDVAEFFAGPAGVSQARAVARARLAAELFNAAPAILDELDALRARVAEFEAAQARSTDAAPRPAPDEGESVLRRNVDMSRAARRQPPTTDAEWAAALDWLARDAVERDAKLEAERAGNPDARR